MVGRRVVCAHVAPVGFRNVVDVFQTLDYGATNVEGKVCAVIIALGMPGVIARVLGEDLEGSQIVEGACGDRVKGTGVSCGFWQLGCGADSGWCKNERDEG